MYRCPVCSSDEGDYGSGHITCKWKDRDDNVYFNGKICDPCWDGMIMPLLHGEVKNIKEIQSMIRPS